MTVKRETQIKCFSKWCFKMLFDLDDIHFASIQTDFTNGVNLLHLTEILSNEKIINGKWHKDPNSVFQINENISIALNFMSKNLLIKNIVAGVDDIRDKNLIKTLGLIWSLFYKFFVENISFNNKKGKDALLQWCQTNVKEINDLNLTNFGKSWMNGLPFLYLIQKFSPNLINAESILELSDVERIHKAFELFREMGIIVYMDEKDFEGNFPDEKSLILQISEIYHYFNEESHADKSKIQEIQAEIDKITGQIREKDNDKEDDNKIKLNKVEQKEIENKEMEDSNVFKIKLKKIPKKQTQEEIDEQRRIEKEKHDREKEIRINKIREKIHDLDMKRDEHLKQLSDKQKEIIRQKNEDLNPLIMEKEKKIKEIEAEYDKKIKDQGLDIVYNDYDPDDLICSIKHLKKEITALQEVATMEYFKSVDGIHTSNGFTISQYNERIIMLENALREERAVKQEEIKRKMEANMKKNSENCIKRKNLEDEKMAKIEIVKSEMSQKIVPIEEKYDSQISKIRDSFYYYIDFYESQRIQLTSIIKKEQFEMFLEP